MSSANLPSENDTLPAALPSPLFIAALQADENDDAVYGWLAEEFTEEENDSQG